MGDTEGYGINFVVMKSSEKMLAVRAAQQQVLLSGRLLLFHQSPFALMFIPSLGLFLALKFLILTPSGYEIVQMP
jgi:hypothetical protein